MLIRYFYVLRHSIFSHLMTCDDNISVYAKILESTAYYGLAKNYFLSQSHTLHCTFYKVDFYIFVWPLITLPTLTITKMRNDLCI